MAVTPPLGTKQQVWSKVQVKKDFFNHTFNRGLICKYIYIYEELKRMDIKKTNNAVKMRYRNKQRIFRKCNIKD